MFSGKNLHDPCFTCLTALIRRDSCDTRLSEMMQIPDSCLNPSFKSSKIVHHVFHQDCRGGAIKPLGNHPLSLLPTRVPKLQPPSNSASTLSTMTCSPFRKLRYSSPESQHPLRQIKFYHSLPFRISCDCELAQSFLPYASLRKS